MAENTEKTIRQPIVAVLGHIDHGKSTLLDYIRKTNIVAGEAGGITQKLGAYEVAHKRKDGVERKITFIDTPGHEAFRGIRERGAASADIAILVVSAEEGAKPQTREAFDMLKQGNTPIIVAITKMDKPNASLERTKQSLSENEIYLEGYGGDIPAVAISAKTGEGIEDLLDMILLIAEMHQFIWDENKLGTGFIIEAERNKDAGTRATLLVRNGKLKKGFFVVADCALAPVRRLEDWRGESIDETGAGRPVLLAGFDSLPKIGSKFVSFQLRRDAEKEREKNAREKIKDCSAANKAEVTDTRVCLPIIIKADASGTIEAIEHEIKKLNNDSVFFKIVARGVGEINEADVRMAHGCKNPMIIGMAVRIDSGAEALLMRGGVAVQTFDVIYKMTEWLQEIAKKNIPKITKEVATGSARILKIFSKERDRQIIGGRVLDGEIKVGDEIKILRRDEKIGTGTIRELQRFKERTDSAPKESEFGASIISPIIIAPQDKIEAISIIET